MIPVVLVVGPSGVGKTTLLEGLMPLLKERGLRVAFVKHHRGEFTLDHQGKDTWRLAKAGADTVVISSPLKCAMIRKVCAEIPLEEILAALKEHDLALVEGYKGADYPKLQVFRRGFSAEPLAPPGYLLGAVADFPLEIDVPLFAPSDTEAIADLLVEYVGQHRGERLS